jgi:FkbM family methyltransferase
MVDKYNPNVFIVEPVPVFYRATQIKFENNPKVRILNSAVGVENRVGVIYMGGDSTSSKLTNGDKLNVKYNTIETILNYFDLEYVDLLQINIEGDEYLLLEDMILTGSVNKFKNIQIQFHLGIEGDIERREKIRNGLLGNGFKINFDYPFVWESWGKK